MAKPTVRVVSSNIALESARELLLHLVGTTGWAHTPDPGDVDLITVRDPLGLPYWFEITTRRSDEQAPAPFEESDATEFILAAQTNDERAHDSLGAFALVLAEATAGWIDLNGTLGYCDNISAERRYFESLELGQGAHAVEYETEPGTEVFYAVMDATAFRKWLAHPDFHLVC